MSLQLIYDVARNVPSDFNEHVPELARLSRKCRHVTEFGMRYGVSTAGLLFGQPEIMISYDLVLHYNDPIKDAAKKAGIDFRVIKADVLKIEIERTDLLFIDTYHTYEQLRQELRLHAGKVDKYIVMHDTTTFGAKGEDGGKGLWLAVQEFLAGNAAWRIMAKYENNNGLTVLKRD